MSDTPPQEVQSDAPEENVRLIPVMAPFQYGARRPPNLIAGENCPVDILFAQGGWSVQGQLNQNDALNFARLIRQAVKDSRSGIIKAAAAPMPAGVVDLSQLGSDDNDELDEDDTIEQVSA